MTAIVLLITDVPAVRVGAPGYKSAAMVADSLAEDTSLEGNFLDGAGSCAVRPEGRVLGLHVGFPTS